MYIIYIYILFFVKFFVLMDHYDANKQIMSAMSFFFSLKRTFILCAHCNISKASRLKLFGLFNLETSICSPQKKDEQIYFCFAKQKIMRQIPSKTKRVIIQNRPHWKTCYIIGMVWENQYIYSSFCFSPDWVLNRRRQLTHHDFRSMLGLGTTMATHRLVMWASQT